VEFFAAQRIVFVFVKLLEQLIQRRQWWANMRAAGTGSMVSVGWSTRRRTVGTRTSPIARSARASIAAAAFWTTPLTVSRTAAFSTSPAKPLAHAFAHRFPLFVVELAVAVFVEFLRHALAHLLASCLTFLIAQFAVAIFIMLFEHPFAHFLATRAVTSLAAVLGRLSKSGQI
jgi:hypothetical protein